MNDATLTTAFSDARYISLATFRRDGREVRTPVWFCAIDDALYCFSAGNAGKVKRIRANGRGRIAGCTMNGMVTGAWQDVACGLVEDRETIENVYVALRLEYGWQMYAADFFARLSGRYNKRAVIKMQAN